MEFSRQTRRLRSINLTPLIDVMFFLIVFFMVSTSFVMSESMELILPSDNTSDTPASTIDSDILHITVNVKGEIEVGDKTININQFDQLIRKIIEQNKDRKIVLSSTPGVSVQQLVNALDVIYVNGGKNVQVDHYYMGEHPDIGNDVKMEQP